jgi:hypothetical protein
MIVNWDFYIRRKRLDVKLWLERKNIKNYERLIEVTKKLGIETPPEEKVSKYFKKPEVKKNDKKIKKPALKRTPKPAPEHTIKADDVSVGIHEKTESSIAPISHTKKQAAQEEQPRQTRKRKPRKKHKLVKAED